jgi:hypothetical protein
MNQDALLTERRGPPAIPIIAQVREWNKCSIEAARDGNAKKRAARLRPPLEIHMQNCLTAARNRGRLVVELVF